MEMMIKVIIRNLSKVIVCAIFLIMGVGTLLFVNFTKSEHSTDLSYLSIDDMRLDSKIDKSKYIANDDVFFKKYGLYSKKNQPNLVFKVNKSNNKLKAMTLTKNQDIKTNFNGEIEGNVQDAIQELGEHYHEKHLRKSYRLITYQDKKNDIKLFIVHKHDKIKKIEIYKK